jgi:hypothetical protein
MFTLRSIHKFNYSKISPKLKSVNLLQLKFNFNSKSLAPNVVSTGFNHTASFDNMSAKELLNKAVQNFYSEEATAPKLFDLPPQLELPMFDPIIKKLLIRCLQQVWLLFVRALQRWLLGSVLPATI